MTWLRRALRGTADQPPEPSVPDLEAMGAAKARREAAAAQRREAAERKARTKERRALAAEKRALQVVEEEAARRAAEKRFGPACNLIGLGGAVERFECQECGRWAEVLPAASAYRDAVNSELAFPFKEWQRFVAAASEQARTGRGIRPALLQRDFDRDYDDAVRILERAVQLGLLDVTAKALQVGQPRCATCYGRRTSAAEAEPEAEAVPRGRREPIPPQLRFRVLQRDAFRCQYCGRSARDGATLHLDHVVPVAAGGRTSEDNLMTACETCNLGKSARGVV